MKYYISDLIPRIQKFSASLDQSSFLVDKPWVVSSGGREAYEKLIFRRDGRVHLSSDGDVTDGKWEYLPEAESLLIDYGNKKRLYRHQFLDEVVLVLKPDGSKDKSDYFLLANEKMVPNLDVESYLISNYHTSNTNIAHLDLGNDVKLINDDKSDKISINTRVILNDKNIPDGEYYYNNGLNKIVTTKGFVSLMKRKVSFGDGIFIWITHDTPQVGDDVVGMKDGTLKINGSDGSNKVTVVNGKVLNVYNPVVDSFAIVIVIIAVISLIVLLFN